MTPRPRSLAGLVLSLTAALAATACMLAEDSAPEGGLQVGLFDEAEAIGNPDAAFPLLAKLRPDVLRVNLRWDLIAPTQPSDPANHLDPAYDWAAYDQLAERAEAGEMELLFHIYGTPAWANGGLEPNRAPAEVGALEDFAHAAASRYSGVRKWAAWNEPNLSLFLSPSWERVGGRLVPVSAQTYADMCNAVWRGVHEAGREAGVAETVACGVTARAEEEAPRFIRSASSAR